MKKISINKSDVGSLLSCANYIFKYQIFTKALIAVWLYFLGKIIQALLKSSGRVAVTSGDYKFLFTTWQGILILLLALISLFVYVASDLNGKIVISRNMLTGRTESLWQCVTEGFKSIGKILNLKGIVVVLYIAFISPILGVGVSISLTKSLYIPTLYYSFHPELRTVFLASAGRCPDFFIYRYSKSVYSAWYCNR